MHGNQLTAQSRFQFSKAIAVFGTPRANDGSKKPEFYLPKSSNQGEWQFTPGEEEEQSQ